MHSVMEVLDPSGHLTLTWSPDDDASVERARAEFRRLQAAGYAFFAIPETAKEVKRLGTSGTLDVRPVQTREFQPRARRTVAVPPQRGG